MPPNVFQPPEHGTIAERAGRLECHNATQSEPIENGKDLKD